MQDKRSPPRVCSTHSDQAKQVCALETPISPAEPAGPWTDVVSGLMGQLLSCYLP